MKTFFTPGPAQLHPYYRKHLEIALDEHIASISHRSNRFRSIYQDTFEKLKALLNIPQGFAILFTGSATEIWERIIQNCVEEHSFHLVNGSFSKRFLKAAQLLQKKPLSLEASLGQGFDVRKVNIYYKAELLALTHNETSTGVMMPAKDIHYLKDQHPQRLVAVDMVSSAPYARLDFNKVDTAFFSVQKGFGMPAGLGVWIVNEKCLAKAESLEKLGMVTGTYHRLTELWSYFEKFETPETPNVLSIYLLGKIVDEMLKEGIDKIREDTETKARMLYSFLEEEERFRLFVENPEHRSQTVIVSFTDDSSLKLIQELDNQGLVLGSGYRDFKDKQIRIANFPAISLDDTERLLGALKAV